MATKIISQPESHCVTTNEREPLFSLKGQFDRSISDLLIIDRVQYCAPIYYRIAFNASSENNDNNAWEVHFNNGNTNNNNKNNNNRVRCVFAFEENILFTLLYLIGTVEYLRNTIKNYCKYAVESI